MFPRSSSNKGLLIFEILIAFSLGTLFIFALMDSSVSIRDAVSRTVERGRLLKEFEKNPELFKSGEKPYGNDRLEIDYEVSNNSGDSKHAQKIQFQRIYSLGPPTNSGQPLCSPNLGSNHIVGSYEAPSVKESTLGINVKQINLPVEPTIPLTDFEIRNNVLYLSSDSNISSDPDFYILNMEDRDNVKLISSINTGPGIAAFSIVKDRIFGAATSVAAQIHIVKLNSLTAPVLEKKIELPVPFATATLPYSSAIFYEGNNVFIGSEKWDGPELNILDVSDIANPIFIGSFETGTKINDIFASGSLLFLADSDEQQLRIVDIRDPARPLLLNSFSPSGWQRQEGKSLSIFENNLFFGRTSGGYDRISDHELFHFASTSSTTLASYISNNMGGGVYGIVADRFSIYSIIREIGKEFQAFQMDGTGNVDFSRSSTFSLPIIPQAISCDGNKIYILSHSSPNIYEITFK